MVISLSLWLCPSRNCLASRDPYCIWLRTGSCANMAPGFKYVSLPSSLSLSVTLSPFLFRLPSEPSSIWQLIKPWRLRSYICHGERRVIYLKDVNPRCLSHSQSEWKDGWGNVMGTNVKMDVSRNVLHALCWYKSLSYKTLLKVTHNQAQFVLWVQ